MRSDPKNQGLFVPDIKKSKSKHAFNQAEMFGKNTKVKFMNVSGKKINGIVWPSVTFILELGRKDTGIKPLRMESGDAIILSLEEAKFHANKLSEQIIRQHSKNEGLGGSLRSFGIHQGRLNEEIIGLPIQGVEIYDVFVDDTVYERVGQEFSVSTNNAANLLDSFRDSSTEKTDFEEEEEVSFTKPVKQEVPKVYKKGEEIPDDELDSDDDFEEEESEEEQAEYMIKKSLRKKLKDAGVQVKNGLSVEELRELAETNEVL